MFLFNLQYRYKLIACDEKVIDAAISTKFYNNLLEFTVIRKRGFVLTIWKVLGVSGQGGPDV